MGNLVIFNDNKAGEERKDASQIKDSVDVGALFLLLSGVRGLKDKDCLSGQEDAGGVEELDRD